MLCRQVGRRWADYESSRGNLGRDVGTGEKKLSKRERLLLGKGGGGEVRGTDVVDPDCNFCVLNGRVAGELLTDLVAAV